MRGVVSGILAAVIGSLVFTAIFPFLYLPPDLVLLNLPMVLLGGIFFAALYSIVPGALGGATLIVLLRFLCRKGALGTRTAVLTGAGIGALAGGLALLALSVAAWAPGILSEWYTTLLVVAIGVVQGGCVACSLRRRQQNRRYELRG
jgi:hypothetical protein